MSSLGQSMKGLHQVVTVSDGTSEVTNQHKDLFGLKLWQLGLLLGIPTALVVFYLMYKKNSAADDNPKKSVDTKKSDGKKVIPTVAKKSMEHMVNQQYIISKNFI